MTELDVDERAVEVASRRFGLPPCLHVPIAARDLSVLCRYVGEVEQIIGRKNPVKAVCLRVEGPDRFDETLPIWRVSNSERLHAKRQLWVRRDYSRYRRAYAAAFPEVRLEGSVADHVMSRQVARIKGFLFLRVVLISRSANASSGGLSEKWGIAFHRNQSERDRDPSHGACIQYADLADIVKMLDMKTGGRLQDPVNDAKSLVKPQ